MQNTAPQFESAPSAERETPPARAAGVPSAVGSTRQLELDGPANSDHGLVRALRQFSDISLEETNERAQMLKRIDNKYTVNKLTLLSFLDSMRADFRLLRIEGRSIFSYRSCYFDDDRQCFREHRQGRRQRFKVRTRLYVDSGKSYFEVKLKGKRGQTDKSRMTCDRFEAFSLSGEELNMVRELYEQRYQKAFHYNLKAALHVTYKRFTLVSTIGGERVTVDFDIGFESPIGKRAQIGEDFVIVETKSGNGRGIADQILKQHRVRQAEGCSKYCIGMVLAGDIERYNKFRPIVGTIRNRMLRTNEGSGQRGEPGLDDRCLQIAYGEPCPCSG